MMVVMSEVLPFKTTVSPLMVEINIGQETYHDLGCIPGFMSGISRNIRAHCYNEQKFENSERHENQTLDISELLEWF